MTKVFSYPTKQGGICFTPRGENVKKLAATHTREIATHKSEIQKVVSRVPDLFGPSNAGNRDVTTLNGCINVLNGQEFVRASRPQNTKKWNKLKVLNVLKFPEIPSL